MTEKKEARNLVDVPYFIGGNELYWVVHEKVDSMLGEIDEFLVAGEGIVATVEFDICDELLELAQDEGYAQYGVPDIEEIRAAFLKEAIEHYHMRLISFDADHESTQIKVKLGGYKAVYSIPTIVEV